MPANQSVALQAAGHDYKSNEYLRAILQATRDQAIISTDINGYAISCSVGTQAVFRIPQEDIPGKDILTLFTDPVFQRELALHIANCDPTVLEQVKLCQKAGRLTWYMDVFFQRVDDSQNHPLGFLCLARDVTEKASLVERLRAVTVTDELTGLYNQRHLYTILEGELARCRTFKRGFVVVFFDLDGLKHFNDTHGHVKGTEAIRETARLMRSISREGIDICFRYGGDEFVIFMPEITRYKARAAAEKIRLRLSEQFHGKITASFGLAESARAITAKELVKRANQAMYWAKTQGKNSVVVWE